MEQLPEIQKLQTYLQAEPCEEPKQEMLAMLDVLELRLINIEEEKDHFEHLALKAEDSLLDLVDCLKNARSYTKQEIDIQVDVAEKLIKEF